MGLHHGVCHVLGGTLNIPHGVANAIVLPHAIRFNAVACAPELAQLARALGLESEGEELAARELARRVAQWMRRMELPFRLRDAGVLETDLPQLADLAVKNKTVQNNPVRVESAQQMEQFLREM
jgi:alcohol dehydrogenase class IV